MNADGALSGGRRAERADAAPRAAELSDLEVLHALLDVARREVSPHFRRRGLVVDDKAADARFDPVTTADRAAEAAMRAVLARLRPDDGVSGEEFGDKLGTAGRLWTLDPIDGTRAFVAGLAHWGVLAALSVVDERGVAQVVLGGMDQPHIGERFWAQRPSAGAPAERCGAFSARDGRQSERLSTRGCSSLGDAVLLATDPTMFAQGEEADRFAALSHSTRMTRFGTDCYGYCALAAGSADLVVEADMKPCDIRALIPIVEAAGGVVTDWRGGSAHEGGRIVAAGDPALHAAALDVLSG